MHWGMLQSIVIVGLLHAGQPVVAATRTAVDYDALARAVTDIESGGNPYAVGLAGERGLMQIKSGTWRDMTRTLFGGPVDFERAFDPRLNQLVGRTYLQHLGERLAARPERLRDDIVRLIAASYNRGPGAIESAGFATRNLRADARDYVNRVCNLYAVYVGDQPVMASTWPAPDDAASFSAPVHAAPEAAETGPVRGASRSFRGAALRDAPDGPPASVGALLHMAWTALPFSLLCAFCVIYGEERMARRLAQVPSPYARVAARLMRESRRLARR